MDRKPIPEIGDAQQRIELAQMSHGSACLPRSGRPARGWPRRRRPPAGNSADHWMPCPPTRTPRRNARRTDAPPPFRPAFDRFPDRAGSSRIARAKCSMAPSGSPCQTRRNPPRNQAAARLGLSITARSCKAMPTSRSPVKWASAWPPRASATASSRPSSTARRARRAPSAASRFGSIIHPLTLRQK